MTMTFETGRTYYTSSIGDSGCIITLTVARRTAKTIVTDEGKRLRIGRTWNGHECVYPWGSGYSMAPILTAEDTRPLYPNDRPLAPELRGWGGVVERPRLELVR